MAEVVVEFTLVSVKQLEQMYPPVSAYAELTKSQVQWDYSFSFAFSRVSDVRDGVTINISFRLYKVNDPAKTTIAETGVSNLFSVTTGLGPEEKLKILYEFLPITVANLQGIYAAKTTGSKLNKILPPGLDFINMKQTIEKRIADGWK